MSVRFVVGVDGSVESRAALTFALSEAARRRARVEVVRAFDLRREWPEACGIPPLTAAEVTAWLRARARAMVHRVVAESDDPALAAVPVEVVAVPGPPQTVLIERAQDADLLVLGHRGRPHRDHGSIALHCATQAPCAVTVVGRGAPAAA